MIRSIRLTLTLWYVGILAVILCLFGWVLYSSVANSLARYLNAVLVSQADGVAATLVAFREAEQSASASAPGNWLGAPSRTLRGDVQTGRLPGLIERWAAQTGGIASRRPVRLISLEGEPLWVSPEFQALDLPLSLRAVQQAQHGHTIYETFRQGEERLRVVTRPVLESAEVMYFVQVATSPRHVDVSLERLRVWLSWLIPATLVLAIAIGWFLATTALQPVGEMIAQARQIGAGQLDQRLRVPRTGDELERLASTFNDMLARLERAFRRLRQFSAAASHELRTPLTVMKGELEVALRKPRTSEEYQQALGAHLSALNDMTRIVEELLTLARSEAADWAVEWHPVELGGLARQIRDTMRPIAESKAVVVEVPADEAIWVRGERRLLERLVVNLLDNAIRHTPSHGRITVQSSQHDGTACLTVRDSGPGVPAEELPQIFDRFFSRRPVSDSAGSTGLGLGLCRWIAEAHHGRVEAASPPGQGATFTVYLPLAPTPA